MSALLPMLVALPLLGAGASMALWRSVRLQQVLGTGILTACLTMSLVALDHVAEHGPIVVHLGDWPAPIGITLVGDLLAFLLLSAALAALLAVFVFAVGQPRADKSAFHFHALYLVLTAGISASFLTADLFNLFVAFEMMLAASYVLLTLGGQRAQVRSGMTYVVINLLASTLLVSGVAMVYAATGTVDMAEASVRLAEVPDGVRLAIGGLLFVALGIKAAIFPLFFWLPDSYPTAPVTVTAVFAGLLTKVGIYAIVRVQSLFFPIDEQVGTVLLVVAALTMVVGVLGAIAQDDMKRILSFHIVSQIGYMLFGLGLFTVSGVAGTIFFVIHQIPVKTALFLVNGLVEQMTYTAALHRLGGLLRRTPLTAGLFLLSALSLAGLPPFSGFFGKLALIRAGVASEAWIVTGVSLAVSLLTLYSMTKIWAGVFWGAPSEPPPRPEAHGDGPLRATRLMNVATVFLVGVTLLIAVLAQPIWELAEQSAGELLDPRGVYVQAVLGR